MRRSTLDFCLGGQRSSQRNFLLTRRCSCIFFAALLLPYPRWATRRSITFTSGFICVPFFWSKVKARTWQGRGVAFRRGAHTPLLLKLTEVPLLFRDVPLSTCVSVGSKGNHLEPRNETSRSEIPTCDLPIQVASVRLRGGYSRTQRRRGVRLIWGNIFSFQYLATKFTTQMRLIFVY